MHRPGASALATGLHRIAQHLQHGERVVPADAGVGDALAIGQLGRVVLAGAELLGAGNRSIFGVMVESHLKAGAQKFTPGKDDVAQLAYGQSITDACIGWDDSATVLQVLSDAVRARRSR